MPTLLHALSGLLTAVLVALVLALGFVGYEMGINHYRVSPVLTGSMRPGIQPGDVVISHRVPDAALAVGDIVLLDQPGTHQAYSHRIRTLTRTPQGVEVTTKGDANELQDPWGTIRLNGTTSYQVVGSLPLLGYVGTWMHQPGVRTSGLIGAGILLLLLLAWQLLPAERRRKILHRPRPIPAEDPAEVTQQLTPVA